MKVLAAAVRDMYGYVWSLPAPCRHHHILVHVPDNSTCEQGFLLENGQFVDRVTAKSHAIMSNQLLERAGDFLELFSEDIW